MTKVFISGTNHFIEAESAKIISSLKDADTETYFGDELDKNEFYSFINSVSLFGNPKIAFIRNAQNIKNPAEFIKTLESCTETHIIIGADKDGLKDPAKLLKGTSFTLIRDKEEKGSPKQVIRIFKEKGMDISMFNAQQIFDMTGGDMVMAENEAEKFAVYRLSDENVSAAELMEFASGEKQEPVYKLVEAFSGRRTSEAFRIYSTIQKTDANLRSVFFALSKRIINLYFSHISESLINEYQDFVKRNISEHRRYWPRKEAAAMVGKASELDADIKTGRKLPENAVNELITLSGIRDS